MKRSRWTWKAPESTTMCNRIIVYYEKWGQQINTRFQRWCRSVPPRRLKVYAVLSGLMVAGMTICSLMLRFSKNAETDFGNVKFPSHLRSTSVERENASRRADRSKLELETLIDSLKADSVGRLMLDSMIKEGRVKLDSSLVR